MAIAEISIIPLGTKTPSVSKYLTRALKTLQQVNNIKYEITSMGTIVEGDLAEILRVTKRMHESTFGDEVRRVITTLRIDDRRDKPLSARGKVESLLKELKH